MATGPREEPIFPGWVKGLIALLVVGIGALVAVSTVEIDLDEIEELFDTTEEVTAPELPAMPPPGADADGDRPASALTSAALRDALKAVRDQVGPTPLLTRLQLNEPFADFHVLRGDQLSGLRYSVDDRSLSGLSVEFVGGGEIGDIAYPIARVDPAAPDRILAGLRRRTETPDLELTSLDLRRDPVSGALRWEVVARAPGGGGEVYYARPDGSGAGAIESSGERSNQSPTPPPAADPDFARIQRLGDCLADATGEIAAVNACFERFGPG